MAQTSPFRSDPPHLSHVWVVLASVALATATIGVYWPTHTHDFVLFDDPEYYTENPWVQQGLTWAGIKWAFTTGYFSYWHPLTWLSHMLDVRLFGASPAGPHLVNLAFHVVNALLLLTFLRRFTGAFWRSFVVAGLFALHPLHVESVAWVSERKDVLSAFFFLLTLRAYGRYVEAKDGIRSPGAERHASRWYCAALLLFACGLMSKPMVVTLPCVLLLLDAWPFSRVDRATFRRRLWPLLREKIPFFALTVAASVVTVIAQRHNDALQGLDGFSLVGRVGNAVVAYERYQVKFFWPRGMAFFYPHPGAWPTSTVLLAAVILAAVTAVVLGLLRREPAAAVGWFLFLGMLVPTIGVIQVGGQAMADRYTYLPSIGLFVTLAWLGAALTTRGRGARVVVGAAALVALVACGVRTREQLGHWRNSEALFRHALAVTENNFMAHNNLGNALMHDGKVDEAMAQYERALAIQPRSVNALHNLATALLRKGRTEQAIARFQQALAVQPGLVAARNALCAALLQSGRAKEAIPHLNRILAADPQNAHAQADLGFALVHEGEASAAVPHFEKALAGGVDDADLRRILGHALLQLGRPEDAIPHLERAAQLQPRAADVHYDLAIAEFQTGHPDAAVPHFAIVAEVQPRNAEALNNFGSTLLALGRFDDAIARFEAALAIEPDAATAHTNIALARIRQGRVREAIARYELLLARQPDYAPALAGLAWLLATWPEASVRDGARAVTLATRANRLSNAQDPTNLRALAAAQAETGEFRVALATAERAKQLAETNGDRELVAAVQAQMQAYAAGRPFREPAVPAEAPAVDRPSP